MEQQNKITMKDRILDYIKAFKSITTFEAFTELGCTRLSEYIRQLREDYDVKDELLSRVNRYGEKVHFKRFWIEDFNGYNPVSGNDVIANGKL